MKYEKNRSLCFNLTSKIRKEADRFAHLGLSGITKAAPYKTDVGTIGVYDVVLGADEDTVLVISLRRYNGSVGVYKGGDLVGFKEARVNDIMVASHSLSELGTTFNDVVERGLNSNWIAANAMYFNSSDRHYRGDEVQNAIDCIRDATGVAEEAQHATA